MKSSLKILIHAHVYYPEYWDDLRHCIDNFISVCDASAVQLVVTYPKSKQDTLLQISNDIHIPSAKFIAVENRGYDVGPFITEVVNKTDLSTVDYIVKIHSKRNIERCWANFRVYDGPQIRKQALSFCSSEAAAYNCIQALEKHGRLGMIANHRMINYACSDCLHMIPVARKELAKLGLKLRTPVSVCSTIFIVRASLLKPFQGKYSEQDFDIVTPENAHLSFGLAGILEFAFPMSIPAQNHIVSEGVFNPEIARIGYTIQAVFFKCLRRLSEIARKTGCTTLLKRVLSHK